MDLLRRSKLGALVATGLDSVVAAVDSLCSSGYSDTATNKTPSDLYALVIGINDYPNLEPLKCAVSDADSITHFLKADLGIPDSHITNLRNSNASRNSIIQGFQSLLDPQIERGSPILIYFAGHGGLWDASKLDPKERGEWEKQYGMFGKFQVIFPYDYGVQCEGGKVNCIPDKTIAELLNQLAKAKGDNITVIFDSCHSASGSRACSTESGMRARSAPVMFPIPENLDYDILPPVGVPPLSGERARHTNPPLCTNQTSHTYLAACGSEEFAWEADRKGAFTAALLKQIRAHGVDKISYHNLMVGLPRLHKQTPHCYGANKYRTLFNGRVPSRKITFIPVIFDPTRCTLTLKAGYASDVTEGSVWEVRTTTAEGHESIVGRAKADPKDASSATLTPENTEDEGAFWDRCDGGNEWEEGAEKLKKLYARLVRCEPGQGNELKVWFSPEAKKLIFPAPEDPTANESVGKDHEVGYVVQSKRDNADIAVELYQLGGTGAGCHPGSGQGSSNGPRSEPEVVFHLCDPQAEKYDIATLRQRKPARLADVETVLFAAARWHWYLRRKIEESTPVELEMFKIGEKNGGELWRRKTEEMNLVQLGLVEFEVHEKDLHAIRLKSRVNAPLYVEMFYFDTTTFAIERYFGHSVSNSSPDPHISSNGEFVIGDGADGDAPIDFQLNPGETLDLGYMKIFWSTEPLELNHLEQESAFKMKVGARPRRAVKGPRGAANQWGSVHLTLVQRAPTGVAK